MWRANRNKYGNTETVQPCAFGFSHRSKLEASVCQLVALRERAGEIKHLRHEDHTLICGPKGHDCKHAMKIEHVVDFLVQDAKTGEEFGIEAKGFANDTWPLKRRLYMHYAPMRLEIWGGHWKSPRLVEVIVPKTVTEGAA